MAVEPLIDIHSVLAILILVAEFQTLLNFFHTLPFQIKFVLILLKNIDISHPKHFAADLQNLLGL